MATSKVQTKEKCEKPLEHNEQNEEVALERAKIHFTGIDGMGVDGTWN